VAGSGIDRMVSAVADIGFYFRHADDVATGIGRRRRAPRRGRWNGPGTQRLMNCISDRWCASGVTTVDTVCMRLQNAIPLVQRSVH
jgi:hypothetical protein